VFSLSIVPTGLDRNLMQNPGTEVPGYFPGVPTGRKRAKLQLEVANCDLKFGLLFFGRSESDLPCWRKGGSAP
jgi:hypothetical protein